MKVVGLRLAIVDVGVRKKWSLGSYAAVAKSSRDPRPRSFDSDDFAQERSSSLREKG